MINGNLIISTVGAEVTHTSLQTASTFHLTASIFERPDLGADYWASLTQAHVRVQVNVDQDSPYTDIIEGYCDSVYLDPVMGFVQIDGRDHSALLLDTKTPTDFQNQTSSDIVRTLAETHDLNPVIVQTSSYAGRRYGDNHNVTSLLQFTKLASDWDVLVALAEAEGFDIFVDGKNLYFQPRDARSKVAVDISYADLIGCRMERLLTLAEAANVTVKSWNSSDGTIVSETAGTHGQQGPRFTVIRPNLSPPQASAVAQQMAREMDQQSMTVELTMPGDCSLAARQAIRLLGTNTVFDQIYQIEAIHRRFRPALGFTQVVRARPAWAARN